MNAVALVLSGFPNGPRQGLFCAGGDIAANSSDSGKGRGIVLLNGLAKFWAALNNPPKAPKLGGNIQKPVCQH